MFHEPATKEEAKTYRYGKWIGNPRGFAFDPCRCAAEVSDGWRFKQCAKKPGSGHDGIYCKTHAKMLKAANALDQGPGGFSPGPAGATGCASNGNYNERTEK